ncbi:ATP-dependent DNA ligase [Synechococcus sp. PCC 7335]|uniref:ATP-dependent DNA ligase n=1 Tax=Synechococcus sp. (strain ATCC 29403 / PCC 7335) TaxID=91464 RepID=UPI0005717352|nr:ATP-dependent DNA ligase [Synechococcus sp. PCC 7335]
MRRFTQLFLDVDATTSTNAKVNAIQQYFHDESPRNAIWALYLLMSKTRKRLITSRVLREIFLQISEIPEWLFEESASHVGDTAETIALLLRDTPIESTGTSTAGGETPLYEWMESVIPQVKEIKDEQSDRLKHLVIDWWANLQDDEIFVLNKVLTGAFRMGASAKLVIKALAAEYGLSEAVLTHRLMGNIETTSEFYQALIDPDETDASPSRPYPFFLAAPIDVEKFATEPMDHWQAEWKWDGIRAQLIYRQNQLFTWSRGEDLITHQFPEFEAAIGVMPEGTVLDGEIVCWDGEKPLDFNFLQKRLGRKRVTKKLMAENPVHFIAYDLLEKAGKDIREMPLQARRAAMTDLLDRHPTEVISYAKPLTFKTFEALEDWRSQSRDQGAEGLMLKALDSPYLVGRKRGYWWKHKVDPMTLDAVMIYAQAGTGKRSNLFTDYTFALWKGDTLVPFTKAYSGLDNAEIEKLDRWIRRHTTEKFGPVRSVEPFHVFEIGFEGIAESKRHKSGIAVRFPRILRWRTDKPMAEADTLESAIALLDNRVLTSSNASTK